MTSATTAPGETSKRGWPKAAAPIRTHRVRTWLRVVQWAGVLLGGAGAAAALSVGLWRWVLAYSNYGPAVVWRWSLPWFAAAVGLLPLFLLGLVSLWRTRSTRVLVYPSGLVYQRGKRALNIPWQEIGAVRTEGPWFGLRAVGVTRPLSLVIELVDAQTVKFTQELSDFKALVETVKQRVYPPMLRTLTERFNQGEEISFGPLRLDLEGIRHGQRTIPWDQFDRAMLKGGQLTLIPSQSSNLKRIGVSAAKIPNIDLCVQMIQGVKTT